MYNAMMDPEFIRLAEEQMSKMPPSEMAKLRQQMMSNPALIRMASDIVKNMRPEDFRTATEQIKNGRGDDVAELSKKIAGVSPEEVASMTAQADAHATYVLNAVQTLKKKGNDLHNQGKFSEAAQKYLLAKNNLKEIPVSKGRTLQLACSLNLMSCYLKTKQFDECIREGTEVLEHDTQNLKALYRRGQAYKELGLLEDAVSDLNRVHSVAPDDETIAEILRDTKDKLSKEGGEQRTSRGLVIEEITEEAQTVPQKTPKNSSSAEYSVTEANETSEISERQTKPATGRPIAAVDSSQGMDVSPETVRGNQGSFGYLNPICFADAMVSKRP